jgi:hypothetical protein
MECSERFRIRWEPLVDLRFRIVPLLDSVMGQYRHQSPPGAALDPVRADLAEWVRQWHLASGMNHTGAQLAMYWHFEPQAAREFYVPKHIRVSLAMPRPVERVHELPEMEPASRRLQCWFEPLNRHGCLLIREDGERLGALDSILAVHAEPARGTRQRRGAVLLKPLGYDRAPVAVSVIHAKAMTRVAGPHGQTIRIDTGNGVVLATGRCHAFAWRQWLRYRGQHAAEFAALDRQIYERHRQNGLVEA